MNTSLPASTFTLGPGRVSYPNGIGTIPSPGSSNWADARAFDQGDLGVRVDNGNLAVRAASGLSPQTGYWSTSWSQYYGEGDVFLTVDDSARGQPSTARVARAVLPWATLDTGPGRGVRW